MDGTDGLKFVNSQEIRMDVEVLAERSKERIVDVV